MSANLLGEASDVLDDAIDLEVALEAVAHLTVPAVADFCAIDMLSPDGTLTRVAIPRSPARRGPAASTPGSRPVRTGDTPSRTSCGEDVPSWSPMSGRRPA